MMYKFGQDDMKFLVLCVKYHMKTDVLITLQLGIKGCILPLSDLYLLVLKYSQLGGSTYIYRQT